MRDILFRGKRVDNGEWIDGCLIWTLERDRYFIREQDFGVEVEVIPETVGQFTGLTDKNGKKIFDGDLIKVNEIHEHWNQDIFQLRFFKGMWTLWADGIDSRYVSFGFFFHRAVQNNKFHSDCMCVNGSLFEIIGNIHDNPELIK